jgi:hypothetical protein
MARSPVGVAMGVSGDVHLQSGAQPIGQVAVSLGSVQRAPVSIGPCGSQQSWPEVQHAVPQQAPASSHVASQGLATHSPFVQYWSSPQARPQRPQLTRSLAKFTQ